jgi:DMSO/TMAO reductase YedYZ heme-binding membrane subunit
VSSRRGRSGDRGHSFSVARVKGPRRGHIVVCVIVALLVVIAGAAASGTTPRGKDILLAVQHFMLFYSGVLALIALTAAVGAGIVATDRIVMAPGNRVVAQAVHRAVSFGALAFLITHIVLEILAHRSHVIDAVVPFLAHGRRFYIGLGTVASDLVVLLIITGIARGRFASRWPWTWRVIHATAYLAWPLSIVHGLLAGRQAKPYVDWSYGGCVAAVALALVIRFVATIRSRREKAPHPLPGYVSSTTQAPVPALMQQPVHDQWSAMPQAGDMRGAVPQARDPRGAMPQARSMPRALPPGPAGRAPGPAGPGLGPPGRAPGPAGPGPGSAGRAPGPNPQPPYIATRRLATPRPDLPIPPSHQQEMRPWQQREWQEQQQDVTPWQQQEWEQSGWQQQQEWEQNGWQQQQAQALEPPEPGPPEYPPEPGYPAYPAYPGAEGS